MPGGHDIEEFNPNNPTTQIALLAMRVDNLGKEKEALERALEKERAERAEQEEKLEKRIAEIEKSFHRGAGIIMVLPIVGTAVGILLAYGKIIFAPWTGKP